MDRLLTPKANLGGFSPPSIGGAYFCWVFPASLRPQWRWTNPDAHALVVRRPVGRINEGYRLLDARNGVLVVNQKIRDYLPLRFA